MTTEDLQEPCSSAMDKKEIKHKPSKRGIIYLSTIPPYMNVTMIRETFGQFGKLGRVYLQLSHKESNLKEKKKKKRNAAQRYTEGWVEYEKKCVAKRVATLLNNTQISTRKKSKYYDYMWNIKYLSNFKWNHLIERLSYERAARQKKQKTEMEMSKKKANFFTANLDIKKKHPESVNKEFENMDNTSEADIDSHEASSSAKKDVWSSLF